MLRRYQVTILGAVIAFFGSRVTAVRAEKRRENVDAEKETKRLVSTDPRVLNVHVVPHTHDDVGWLKTVDQYYYGLNNTIQVANVQAILDSTVCALEEDPARKFTYVEMAFFTMWWNEQTDDMKERVRKLVAQNRLTFANGGWCMHDEATTYYMGMIDQTTLGHSFLMDAFGYAPRVGWQVDPFGHSATQASLMSAEMGFDALFFGRIDRQDLKHRHDTRRCEGLWRSSPNLGRTAEVFFSLTGGYKGNYCTPPGFWFDTKWGDYEPLVKGMNVDERVSKLVEFISWQANLTVGNNVMLTMGCDFQYEDAPINFRYLDNMIRYTNERQRNGQISSKDLLRFDSLRLFYSTPEMFMLAKQAEKIRWEVKTDDFFPYSDRVDSYWTGYFTSRPSLKLVERYGSAFLHAARQLDAMKAVSDQSSAATEQSDSPLYSLETSVAVVQHHDGVSGTSKQHVADDYVLRVDRGIKEAAAYIGKQLESALGLGSIDLRICQLLNETKCSISQNATLEKDTDVFVVVYNALSSVRQDVISIPVASDATYSVNLFGEDNGPVQSALFPSPLGVNEGSPFLLHAWTGPVPPLGAIVLRVKMESTDSSAVRPSEYDLCSRADARDVVVSYGDFLVAFDSASGTVKSVGNGSNRLDVTQTWGFYTSYRDDGQNSGAYIFRPKEADEELNVFGTECTKSTVYRSDLVSEVHTELSPWASLVTRVKMDTSHVDVHYTIGPIESDDGAGREIVTRYSSESISNKGVFYTDSNGREFVQRRLGRRPTWTASLEQPVSGNYYPVTSAIYIEDNTSSLAVLTDRSQGGSSLKSGSVELMVHRRIFDDDDRGVGEALNETDRGISPYPPYGNATRKGRGLVITGRHRLRVGSGNEGAKISRSHMDSMFSPFHLFFGATGSEGGTSVKTSSFSGLSRALPQNVMVITFERIHNLPGAFLVRLGHQYAAGESTGQSKPVRVDLADLFANLKLSRITEMTLSGNQELAELAGKRKQWASSVATEEKAPARGRESDDGFIVQLNPMEIRTFRLFSAWYSGHHPLFGKKAHTSSSQSGKQSLVIMGVIVSLAAAFALVSNLRRRIRDRALARELSLGATAMEREPTLSGDEADTSCTDAAPTSEYAPVGQEDKSEDREIT